MNDCVDVSAPFHPAGGFTTIFVSVYGSMCSGMFRSHDLATTQHALNLLPSGSHTSFNAPIRSSIVLLLGVAMITFLPFSPRACCLWANANLDAMYLTSKVLPTPGGPQTFVSALLNTLSAAACCVFVSGLLLESIRSHCLSRFCMEFHMSSLCRSTFSPMITWRLNSCSGGADTHILCSALLCRIAVGLRHTGVMSTVSARIISWFVTPTDTKILVYAPSCCISVIIPVAECD